MPMSKCLVDKNTSGCNKFHAELSKETVWSLDGIFSPMPLKHLNAVENMIQLPFSWEKGSDCSEATDGRRPQGGSSPTVCVQPPRSLNECHLSLLCSSKIWEHKPRPFLSHLEEAVNRDADWEKELWTWGGACGGVDGELRFTCTQHRVWNTGWWEAAAEHRGLSSSGLWGGVTWGWGGGREAREGGTWWCGTQLDSRMFAVVRLTQHCKAIILQLKKF